MFLGNRVHYSIRFIISTFLKLNELRVQMKFFKNIQECCTVVEKPQWDIRFYYCTREMFLNSPFKNLRYKLHKPISFFTKMVIMDKKSDIWELSVSSEQIRYHSGKEFTRSRRASRATRTWSLPAAWCRGMDRGKPVKGTNHSILYRIVVFYEV